MEAFKECPDLRLYFIAHADLRHLANPLLFILFVDEDGSTSRNQFFHFVDSELVADIGEVEFVSHRVRSIVLH